MDAAVPKPPGAAAAVSVLLPKAPAAADVEEILRRVEPEFGFRRLAGPFATAVGIVAGGMALFHLYTARFGLLEALRQRSLHLAFVMVLVFLLYPARRRWAGATRFGAVDVALAGVGAAVMLYLFVNHQSLAERAGRPEGRDLLIGVLGTLVVLEAGRRVLGVLPFIAAAMLIYPFVGHLLPGSLAVPPVSLPRVIEHMFLTTEAIFGIPVGVSASFVFMFVLLGAFLERTGLGQLFVDIAISLAGWMTGGPAKVSVLSSAFVGTISGSSVANVVADGVFNIPLMKRLGYHPVFAGGVEAATSVGGQLMPPVMGAAAFVMAEYLEIPYLTIAKAAALPAIFYFLAVGLMIHFEAKRLGLRGLPRDQLPAIGGVLWSRGYLVAPLVAVVAFLFRGYSPMMAAFWGIAVSAGVHVITVWKEGAAARRPWLDRARLYVEEIWTILVYGTRNALTVAVATAVVGIILGVVTLTGIGLKFVGLTVALGQHNLFLTLVFVAAACTIIGSGIPTTATYIILAAIAAPALSQLGVMPLAAHLFIFYFGVIADLTPPDALAAYAAAGIARSDPLRTGFAATRLALAGIIVPFVFVYSPALLLQGGGLGEVLLTSLTGLLGVIALAAGASGYLLAPARPLDRVLLIAAAIALIFHKPSWDLVGLVLLGGTALLQRARARSPAPS
ncbi:MAG TPA: TRAP transporter permease [bacterium]|jgi:TRAP transporter 4TM/12TM fusion protein|nr:TRAP transporter permease [bacterium]